jgi:D-serine deaminase-like pyridoxal phosphate-dependent protein
MSGPNIRPAEPGMPLAEADTPCLILDVDAMERNMRRLQESLAGKRVRVRPHAKSHKSARIALRQMDFGAIGVCCQKVSEAEALIAGGVPDVTVTNEVVGAPKLARLAKLAPQARLTVSVDDPANVVDLAAAMSRAGLVLNVLVEMNVGGNRCGVEPGEATVALARDVCRQPSLRFAGLQAYFGSAQHMRAVADRKAAIDECARKVALTKDMLRANGIECPLVTGGGTGSYQFEAGSGVFDELQVGSYIFMDADYQKNEWEGSGIPRFEQSLFIWTTVMSATTPGRAVVDAGLKACATDSGMPAVTDHPGVTYARASDEHGVLTYEGGQRYRVGDKIRLTPGHCDPTVNLYDWYVCVRGNTVQDLWPVDARGAVF